MSQLPSQGITLLLTYFLGIFGADKFYLGLTGQGIAMLLLTLTLFGLVITIPWTYLSCLFLVISILWNGKPMLYPSNIQWAPLTNTDKTITWIIVGVTFIGIIAGFFVGNRRIKYIKEDDKNKQNQKI